MWIDCKTSLPLRTGRYRVLLELDEMGTLSKRDNELFNGKDWDRFESNCQFIRYWWASTEEYKEINRIHNEAYEQWFKEQQQEVENDASKNFGGL